MTKSIAVIGQGFVGGSLTTVFSERGFDVYAYDKAGKYAKGALPCHGDPATGYPKSIAELISNNENGKHRCFLMFILYAFLRQCEKTDQLI